MKKNCLILIIIFSNSIQSTEVEKTCDYRIFSIHTNVIKEAIKDKADLNAKFEGNTALMRAVIHNDFTTAKLLIDSGADLEGRDKDGNTALILSFRHNRSEIAKLLIDSNANVNAKNDYGHTALMVAALHNRLEMTKLLINSRADLDAQNKDGNTALMLAIFKNRSGMAKLLINSGANPDIQNNEGATALMFAESRKDDEVVKLIKEKIEKMKKENSWVCGELLPPSPQTDLGIIGSFESPNLLAVGTPVGSSPLTIEYL